VLVGTRNQLTTNPSEFFGLSLTAGGNVAGFNGGGTLGPINGTPAVDYATQRVYFASRQHASGPTVWCVQVNATDPALSPAAVWSRNLGDVDGSPVLRNGRVYFGANSGVVYSLDAATGLDDRTVSPGDGPVKGFLFPDRRNDSLIFATSTKVWSVSDTAGGFVTNWTWTMPSGSPSIVLYWPQTNFVYVGGGNGRLYELDFTNATPGTPPTDRQAILGDGTGQIGAPTLDIGVTPRLLIVGSESGVLYGVEVPLP
jgi:outer membrane protein assembly factor BamB